MEGHAARLDASRGAAPAATGLDVEQVHYDTVRHLRLAWHNEDFPSVDVAGHLEEAKDVDMKRQSEVFAAFERDRPIAFAQLERAGTPRRSAASTSTREHRGRGSARR